MTKIVNLDELAAPKRTLTYKGESHEVLDLDVSRFIEFQADFNALLESQAKDDMAGGFAAAQRILSRSVPTFKDAEKLNLRQLMAAVQLVSEFYPQTADSEGAPAGNA